MLSRETILSIESALSLFAEISFPLAIVYLEARNVQTVLGGTISHNATMVQRYQILFYSLFLFCDSKHSSNFHCSASEH